MRISAISTSRSVRIALITLALLACGSAIKAQDDPAMIETLAKIKSTPAPAGWRIFVTFNKSFTAANEAAVQDEANFTLFDVAHKAFVNILESKIATTKSGKKIYSMVELRVDPLTAGNFYQLYVSGLTFDQESLKEPIASRVNFASTASDEETKPSLPVIAADDREDANVYLAGEVTRASGTEFNGSADVKLAYTIAEDFWNRSQFFEPFFDLKANSDPEADPDTMKFGVDWDFLAIKRSGSRKFFKPARWKNSFLVEAERDFDNTNLIWGSRLVFPSRVLHNESRTVRFYLRPFFGVELGKNIKSPVKEAEDRGIARGLFGSTMVLAFPVKQKNLASIVLESSYTRRLLMLREVFFEKADDDKLRPVFFARNPRDWIEAKLSFNFSDAFGTYIGYEYGQQPPSYKLVDHRMKIGLVYKIKVKKPEE